MTPTRKDIENYADVVSNSGSLLERAMRQPVQKVVKPRKLTQSEIETLCHIIRDAWNNDTYKYLLGDIVQIARFLEQKTSSDRLTDLLHEFKNDLK